MAKILKAIYAHESKSAAREKAAQVEAALLEMKPKEAAKVVGESIGETLSHMDFSYEHRLRVRTNNVIERMDREIAAQSGFVKHKTQILKM